MRRSNIARCEICGRKVKQPSRSILNGRILCSTHNPRPDQRARRRDDHERRDAPGPPPRPPVQISAEVAEPALVGAAVARSAPAPVEATVGFRPGPMVAAVAVGEPAVEAALAAAASPPVLLELTVSPAAPGEPEPVVEPPPAASDGEQQLAPVASDGDEKDAPATSAVEPAAAPSASSDEAEEGPGALPRARARRRTVAQEEPSSPDGA